MYRDLRTDPDLQLPFDLFPLHFTGTVGSTDLMRSVVAKHPSKSRVRSPVWPFFSLPTGTLNGIGSRTLVSI
jgi:hypothetical protein